MSWSGILYFNMGVCPLCMYEYAFHLDGFRLRTGVNWIESHGIVFTLIILYASLE